MLVKCEFKTCKNYDNGHCASNEEIELKAIDYKDENESEQEALTCTRYKYDWNWMYREE